MTAATSHPLRYSRDGKRGWPWRRLLLCATCLLCVYVGGWLWIASHCWITVAASGQLWVRTRFPQYPFNGTGSFLFQPAYRIDRFIRPSYWYATGAGTPRTD
jgi:hypothetical protein